MSMLRHTLAMVTALFCMSPLSLLGQPKLGRSPITDAEVAAAIDYWTPERRASAIPRSMDVHQLPTAQEAVTPSEPLVRVPGGFPTKAIGGPEAVPAEGAPEAASVEPLGFAYPYPFTRYNVIALLYNSTVRKVPYTTVGKLFFTLSGLNYVCSASVIRPHLLLTARHCVYDYGAAVWATNVVFYPGYFNGAPNTYLGGAWAARVLMTWTAGAPDYEYDIGMIQTFNKNQTGCAPTGPNPQIESYTGFLGYQYGGNYATMHFDPFGYPAAAPFNGNFMVQCESASAALNQGGFTNTIEVGCDQTGGCSGGPWITTFRPAVTGTVNYAAGLNSFRFTSPSRPLAINGPQFLSNNFNDLLTFAMAEPCP